MSTHDFYIPTRGERNNNPGNIRKSKALWVGEIPSDDEAFEKFESPEDGFRALARTLVTYRKKHGLDTIEAIINRWAPPVENNTHEYIAHVCAQMDTPRFIHLNMYDPKILTSLCKAVCVHENGRCVWSDDVISKGVIKALSV
jgi:hypothetical protein